MQCVICDGKTAENGSWHGYEGIGWVCSEDCAQIGQGRRKAFHDELRAEPLGQLPEELTTGDFERWALKLSLHFLADTDRAAQIIEACPFMGVPEQLALDLKDRILRHIKPCYVSEVEARGHERLLHGGTYCFRQPVPATHILEAAEKAKVIA